MENVSYKVFHDKCGAEFSSTKAIVSLRKVNQNDK